MLDLIFNNKGLSCIPLFHWQDACVCLHCERARVPPCGRGSLLQSGYRKFHTQPQALTCRVTACLSDREPSLQTSFCAFLKDMHQI